MRLLKDQITDIEKVTLQNSLHLQALEEYCSHNLYAGLLLAMAQLEAFVDYFKTLDPDKHGKMTEFVAKRSREIAELQFERMQKAQASTSGEKAPDESPALAGASGDELDFDEGRDLTYRIQEQEIAIDASRMTEATHPRFLGAPQVRQG